MLPTGDITPVQSLPRNAAAAAAPVNSSSRDAVCINIPSAEPNIKTQGKQGATFLFALFAVKCFKSAQNAVLLSLMSFICKISVYQFLKNGDADAERIVDKLENEHHSYGCAEGECYRIEYSGFSCRFNPCKYAFTAFIGVLLFYRLYFLTAVFR